MVFAYVYLLLLTTGEGIIDIALEKEGVFLKNLQIIRRKRNMSQLSLAMKLEVAQETVSAYERGKTYPGVETLLRVQEIF